LLSSKSLVVNGTAASLGADGDDVRPNVVVVMIRSTDRRGWMGGDSRRWTGLLRLQLFPLLLLLLLLLSRRR
jgi:hypothetical protein